ncbi:restriction endonuclease subunit S [Campylobacter jejuni]|nr:restriction endonuclease subunit S [Campylobacter jejuni]EJK3624604.1 restriction endonuclease subunit S [Campylobacter jejuni]
MNKIEKLLNELCPNGVEFRELQDVCNLRAGERITTSMMSDEFEFPVMGGGVEPTGYYSSYNFQNVVTIARAGSAGFVSFQKNKFWATDVCFVASAKTDLYVNIKYVFYFLKNYEHEFKKHLYGGSMPKLEKRYLWEFQIPIPPIEIQEEIVKILDTFTELEAELEARRRQYEYYRNKLLSFEYLKTNGGGYELKMLGEVCEISTGGSNSVDEEMNGIYPFYTRSQEIKRINRYEFDETAIITSGDGVGVGKIIHFIQGKYALHQRAYRIHILQDSINPKFVYFYMKAYFYDYIMKTAVSSSVSSLRMKMLTGFQIPIPPLATQEKIVNILDQFHALTTDLQSGIPAEIEARKKQYEYYRNQLLTFKEAI